MKKIKKQLLTIMLTVMCSFMIGCGVNQEQKENKNNSNSGITLKVITNRTDIVDTELKKFGEEYKKKTGINIEWEAAQDYNSTMQVRVRANDNYGDVLLIPGISSEEYSQYFEPLGKASDSDISEYKINKTTAIKESGDYIVYGLSYGLGAQGIVYNKKAFEKAGINSDDMKTIEGFYEGCEKLKENGIIPVATNFKDSWTLGNWYVVAKCMSGNAEFENKLYKEDSIFDKSKPLGQMLDFSGTLINNGWVEDDLLYTDWDGSKQGLADGNIGMMFLGTWVISQEKALAKNPEDIGFMPIPTNDGNTYTYLEPDHAFVVSNKSKHKKEAREFLFAFNESDYASNNGFIPNNTKLTEMDPVIKEFLNSGVNQLIQQPASEEDLNKTSNIFNKASINTSTFVQKPFLYSIKGKDKLDEYIVHLNEDWNNAKKELGY